MLNQLKVDPLVRPDVFFQQDATELAAKAERMLDFGAGRGNYGDHYRGLCRDVHGCDIDPVVLTNPFVHAATVLEKGKPLPFPDEHFDLVVSRYVLEHVDDPVFIVNELVRILRPGGYFLAVTPNKWGYIAVAARLIPERLHDFILRYAKPGLQSCDVFPKLYLMNTEKELIRLFAPYGQMEVRLSSGGSDYDFGFRPLAIFFRTLNRLLPRSLQTAMYVKFRKNRASEVH